MEVVLFDFLLQKVIVVCYGGVVNGRMQSSHMFLCVKMSSCFYLSLICSMEFAISVLNTPSLI